jgi:general secretion pathway protein F/type IV pilus assembly protein PilC
MALFHYRAVAVSGKNISGVIDADSMDGAKERLHKQKILVTQLHQIKESKEKIDLKPALLLAFTRELSQLLRAGLPLYESLLTIEEKYKRHEAHPLFLDLCDHLKSGHSLSSALKRYPKSFDRVYLAMVAAAEESASLSGAFEQLSLLISKQQKLKKQLLAATAYPLFLACFCLLVVCGLLFFVIPSMKELFEDRQLHPLTKTVLAISGWVNTNGLLLLFLIILLISAIVLSLRSSPIKQLRQQLFLKIPLCKTLMVQTAIVRFCRTASLLLASGIPLLETLSYSRGVMKNLLLEKEILSVEQKVMEGCKISAELKHSLLIPPLLIRMLALAEETGNLSSSFHHVAEILEEDVERSLNQLTTLLQPLLLLLIGAIVGVVVLSILLPLTDVSSFLS